MGVEIMTPPGMEEMANQLQGLFQNLGQQQKKKRKIKVNKTGELIWSLTGFCRLASEDG